MTRGGGKVAQHLGLVQSANVSLLYGRGHVLEPMVPFFGPDLERQVPGAQHWVIDLANEANQKFVAGFRAKYKRDPSFYAAQAYDAAYLIDSAVAAVKGDLSKKDDMRAQMRRADYASVRGPYKYGNNHFPIQNFYLQEAVAAPDGSYTLKTVATALTAHQDRYHDRCPMSW